MSHEKHQVPRSTGQPLAYRGKEGCRSVICTRNPSVPDRCYGWHCGTCDEPTSYQGHDCPGRAS